MTVERGTMTEFWLHKSLAQMTESEWEALCDGCGKCCLHKLLDAGDDGEAQDNVVGETDGMTMTVDETLYYTDIHCQHLDPDTARCQCYASRLETVAMCVNITLADLPRIHFMPSTCAYRRLHEGKGLPDWHPLRHGGSQRAMKRAGVSVTQHPIISERDVDEDDYELRIVTWPL